MKQTANEMNSRQSKGEAIAALCWAPVHAVFLPLAVTLLYYHGFLSLVASNVLVYAIGLLFMAVTQWKFLRRDFDPLCDRPAQCVFTVIGSYFAMIFCNVLVGLAVNALTGNTNQNNDAMVELLTEDNGPMISMAVFMAPIVEELIFRAGVYGTIRRYNRFAAIFASVLLFSLYHVVSYAIADPAYWVYILEYIPASLLLVLCYERTDTIWAPIFLHMLTNYMSVRVLTLY